MKLEKSETMFWKKYLILILKKYFASDLRVQKNTIYFSLSLLENIKKKLFGYNY